MAAALFDIIIECGCVFALDVLYKDKDDVAISVADWGGAFVVVDKVGGTTLITADNDGGEIIFEADSVVGLVQVRVPVSMTEALTDRFGQYSVVIWPDTDFPALDRVQLLRGNVTIEPLIVPVPAP